MTKTDVITAYMLKSGNDANLKILATKEDISNTKAEMIKWMFLFWIGQIAVTFGFILLFIKK